MSDKFKKTGLLHVKEKTKQHSEKFKTRDFVLHIKGEEEKWDQYIPFTLKQDNCKLLDVINEGTTIEVEAIASGRRWKNPDGVWKYFASNTATNIDNTENDLPF